MSCDRWTEALSALADGEDPGVDERLLDAHLTRCRPCRHFRDELGRNRRRSRIAVAPTMPDLSRRVAKLNAVADRASRWSVVRALLAVAALQIIGLSAPALVLGDGSGGSPHGARHLGAFSVAYAVGLLVVVVRPARARTMQPVAQVLGGALVLSAVADVATQTTAAASEVAHLPELVSVVLVWLLARPAPRRPLRGRWRPARPLADGALHRRDEAV